MSGADGPPRALFIAALGLAVVAVGALLVIALNRQPRHEPVAISAVPAPHAADPGCASVIAALPEQLGDYRRAEARAPVPPGAAAWTGEPGAEPVILRCGLDRPSDFVVGSPIQLVDEVQWFRVSESPAEEGARATWFAVDRPVYLALTLPPDAGATPIQELSRVISRTLPARAIEPIPPR